MNNRVYLRKPNYNLLAGGIQFISPADNYFLSPAQEWARPYIDRMIKEKQVTANRDGVLGIFTGNLDEPRMELTVPSLNEIKKFQIKRIKTLEKELAQTGSNSQEVYSEKIENFRSGDYYTILRDYIPIANTNELFNTMERNQGINGFNRPIYHLLNTLYIQFDKIRGLTKRFLNQEK